MWNIKYKLTFNLPSGANITNSVDTNVSVKGNGKTLGLTDGTNNFAFTTYPSLSELRAGKENFNQNVGTSGSYNDRGTKLTVGITTDPTKSGIVGTVTRTQITVNVFQRIS